jgi:adenylate cyclase
MPSLVQRTVLFVDLRGSTGLFETLGNAQAASVVTHSVSLMAQIVKSCGGTVVKTLGDGLMAVFERPPGGIEAADEMHESLDRVVSDAPRRRYGARLPALRLQVANETLCTQQVLDGLDSEHRGRFRSLARLQLRGRQEPVQVYRLEARRFGETVATTFEGAIATTEPDGIRLTWLEGSRTFAGTDLPAVLGRSPQATYCIDDTRVSRLHARVDWHGGTFQLTDLSYNGTYVRFDHDPEVISLRRGTCTLHGSGLIGLGTPPVDDQSPCVRFEVIRFADTQPHDLPRRA